MSQALQWVRNASWGSFRSNGTSALPGVGRGVEDVTPRELLVRLPSRLPLQEGGPLGMARTIVALLRESENSLVCQRWDQVQVDGLDEHSQRSSTVDAAKGVQA